MKRALIIIGLILSGMVYGQDELFHVLDPWDGTYIDMSLFDYEANDTIEIRTASLEDAIWILDNTPWGVTAAFDLRLRQLYIEDCYVDSFAYKVNVLLYDLLWFTLYVPDKLDPSDKIVASKIDTIYEHKQPTFEGYTEWLENLLK